MIRISRSQIRLFGKILCPSFAIFFQFSDSRPIQLSSFCNFKFKIKTFGIFKNRNYSRQWGVIEICVLILIRIRSEWGEGKSGLEDLSNEMGGGESRIYFFGDNKGLSNLSYSQRSNALNQLACSRVWDKLLLSIRRSPPQSQSSAASPNLIKMLMLGKYIIILKTGRSICCSPFDPPFLLALHHGKISLPDSLITAGILLALAVISISIQKKKQGRPESLNPLFDIIICALDSTNGRARPELLNSPINH